MIGYVWLLVPVDRHDLYTAEDSEAFMDKEKAIATGLNWIESYGKYERWSKDFTEANKTEFLEEEVCDCCYLAIIPLHSA